MPLLPTLWAAGGIVFLAYLCMCMYMHAWQKHSLTGLLLSSILFTARRYASAVYAMALCASVCHKSVFYLNA